MTYEKLLRLMPAALAGGHDPLHHTRIADLAWLAQHELDLYEEGEETDIRTAKDRSEVRTFLAACQCAIDEEKAAKAKAERKAAKGGAA